MSKKIDSEIIIRFKIHGVQAIRPVRCKFWNFGYFGRVMSTRLTSAALAGISDSALKDLADGFKKLLIMPKK